MTMNPNVKLYETYQKMMKEKEAMDTQYLELKEKCEEMEQFIRDLDQIIHYIKNDMLEKDWELVSYHIGRIEMMVGLCVQLLNECDEEGHDPLTP